QDSGAERINGTEIRIGNSKDSNGNNTVCAEVSTIPAGATNTFQCNGIEGRYINLVIPGSGKILALCEVELVPCVSTETNVALGKMATQSSEWNSKTGAIKANDGNPNSVFRQNSCSCTKRETAPWWRVNLVREFIVSSVTITNRGDCCSERINGAEIRIGNSLENNGNSNPRQLLHFITFILLIMVFLSPKCATIPSIPPGGASTFHCHGMRGRYVNIYLPRTDYLTLCEVVVAGSPTFENVALRGRATQSSQYNFLNAADKAIDGNRHALHGDGSCSQTRAESNPWWRLDLLDMYRVTSVNITNRGDCCPERINGAEIRVGNSLLNNGNNNPVCAIVASIPAGAIATYQCNKMEGRYINIIIPGANKVLALCEVEVSADPLFV
ncbi:hypothetical protein Z043_122714, partial [Scleropages formosus]